MVLSTAPAPPDAAITIAARARSMRPGELVVLTITTPPGVDRVRVRAFDRDVPAFRAGDREWEALVGIDLDLRRGSYRVAVAAGDAHAEYTLAVTPRVFPTRRLKVDE